MTTSGLSSSGSSGRSGRGSRRILSKHELRIRALEKEIKRLRRIIEEGEEAYDDLLEEEDDE